MIPIKTEKEIAVMKEGGKILATILQKVAEMAQAGVSTNALNKASEALIFDYKAEPAFKGYIGSKKGDLPFPSALCASVNNMVVHAAPSDYILKAGDLLSLDLGIKYKGFYADMATSLIVAKCSTSDVEHLEKQQDIDFEAVRLVKATKKALRLGIKKAKPGNTFGDIGNTIQRFVEDQGFQVVRELCGHGIGKQLHEDPQIPNFGKRKSGDVIKPGMVFCIEPMITMGDWHLQKSPDGFGLETKDGSLACHFEHTIAITPKGNVVLTKL